MRTNRPFSPSDAGSGGALKLSTAPFGHTKKTEMKREKSPLTPYKRKAKGKETSPGSWENPLSPHGRGRAREGVGRYRLAGGAARELMAILHAHSADDFRLWAWYCYRHDVEILIEKAREFASMSRQGELKDAITAFQSWLNKSFGDTGNMKGNV